MLIVLGVLAISAIILLFIAGALEIGGLAGWLLALGIVASLVYGAVNANAAVLRPGNTSLMAARQPKSLVDHLAMPGPPKITFVRSADPQGAGAAPGQLPVPGATDESTGTVYYSQPLDNFQRAHEAGHVFDSEVLTSADRLRAEQIMGLGKGRWNTGTGLSGYTSPDEHFADYYSAAVNHLDLSRQGYSSYTTFTPKRLSLFETWLSQLGQSRGLSPYQR